MKWLGKLSGAFGGSGPQRGASGSGDATLLDHESFDRELRRRRALVDRVGGRFVLLVFEVETDGRPNGHTAAPKVLCDVVRLRSRLSDVAGYYDRIGSKIAVLLQETDEAGTARFIESVEGLVRSESRGGWRAGSKLKCSVSHYPEIAEARAPEPEPIRTPAHKLQPDTQNVAARTAVRQ